MLSLGPTSMGSTWNCSKVSMLTSIGTLAPCCVGQLICLVPLQRQNFVSFLSRCHVSPEQKKQKVFHDEVIKQVKSDFCELLHERHLATQNTHRGHKAA